MAARDIIRGVLLIAFFIAPAVSCGPLFGEKPRDALPADLTARVSTAVRAISLDPTCPCGTPGEDDLRKFVPEMHPFEPPIRIQDLVRCRTGLWDQIAVSAPVGWEIAPLQHPYAEADLVSLLAGQTALPFQPELQYRSSMSDYFVLGGVVKRVSGQSLAEFARKRIFAPLGMSRSFFEVDPGAVVGQRPDFLSVLT